MPRRRRIDLPHVTQHVVQRGNDRQPCFFTASDYERYRSDLREISLHEGCEIHAYVLLTNHVRLLMTPSDVRQLACIVQALGRRCAGVVQMPGAVYCDKSGYVVTRNES